MLLTIGVGESTLVDDLLDHGYANITVLDISQSAIDANRKRLGKAGSSPTSLESSWSPPRTTCGTTALSFLFLLRAADHIATSAKSLMR